MADPAAIAAAMQRMWTQFRPQIDERVDVLEAAAAAVATGTLTEEQCKAAAKAAHSLAGTLGTFGLSEGTALSREAEPVFSEGLPVNQEKASRLAVIASELRTMIVNKA
jgi:HPt (histidine-containing phosphotransfer) domain-containing protein